MLNFLIVALSYALCNCHVVCTKQQVALDHKHLELINLCPLRNFPLPAMAARFTVFWTSRSCGPSGWLALHLIKVGDVETNPGPTTTHNKSGFAISAIKKYLVGSRYR